MSAYSVLQEQAVCVTKCEDIAVILLSITKFFLGYVVFSLLTRQEKIMDATLFVRVVVEKLVFVEKCTDSLMKLGISSVLVFYIVSKLIQGSGNEI